MEKIKGPGNVFNTACEIPQGNPPSEEIRDILESYHTIAVVGLSPKPQRDSHQVATYMQDHGYTIVPVNPGQKEILGRTCYRDLKAIPLPVDVVNIFRRPDAVPAIIDDAIAISAKVVWMQLGIANNSAAQKARTAGLQVVQNKCIKIEHMKLKGARHAHRGPR